MGRRWLVPAITVVLAVGGCGGDPPATPSAAPPAATPASTSASAPGAGSAAAPAPGGTSATASVVADTREFVTAVRNGLPDVAADRTDGEISKIGAQICAGLAGGDTADDLVASTRSLNTADAEATDHATARELIKLAIDVACPGQAGRVDEF